MLNETVKEGASCMRRGQDHRVLLLIQHKTRLEAQLYEIERLILHLDEQACTVVMHGNNKLQ